MIFMGFLLEGVAIPIRILRISHPRAIPVRAAYQAISCAATGGQRPGFVSTSMCDYRTLRGICSKVDWSKRVSPRL
jgi:hypothetical protein